VTIANFAQDLFFLLLVTLLVKPVGRFVFRVFAGEKTLLDRPLVPIEKGLHRLLGIHAEPMEWKTYAAAFVAFGLVGTAILYVLLRVQLFLPGGPDKACLTTPMTDLLALNTAISFTTTTTWQAYAGETTLRYWTQLVGLAAQNFGAGAAGLAVGIAFIRGIAQEKATSLGNFWVDLVRGLLWILLPASLLGSLVVVWQGVPVNFHPYVRAATVERATQIIPQGPVAALELIKNLGTNGGGFFNANGAHPFENPTPLTNFIALLAVAVIPASLTHVFGRMVGRPRVGWMLYGVMITLFLLGLVACEWAERGQAPALPPGAANMEGKEVRFGVGGSVLAALVTSNGATGSYVAMYDSFMPLSVLVLLVNMFLGEMIFGGLGTGLYSIVIITLVALFLGGLMIGRTPEFLGKTLGPRETRLVVLFTLITSVVVLSLTAIGVATPAGRAGLTTNTGPHGLTEILFAYASCVANNGQSMAGLSANTPFYNLTTALAMLAGRFGLGVLALALAGQFAAQGRRPESRGTLPIDSLQFGTLTVGVALIVAGLSFLPAVALGPLVEHFQLTSGR
jgi:K+-transporting ATPase ATPase A chain